MDALTPEQWRRTVDAALEVQAEILTNIQAELIESDRLSNSVERLGDGASELGAALLQVDRNQQALTRLGQQLEQVEAHAATKDDVEDKAERERRNRRRAVTLVLVPVVAGFTILGGMVGYVSHSAHESCERRQEQAQVLIALLGDFKRGGPGDARIDVGIQRLNRTLVRSCDEQYPIHLP